MQLDIAGSDIGRFTLNGQYGTPENPKANNHVNISSSKLESIGLISGAGLNTVNVLSSEITGTNTNDHMEGIAIRIQDTRNNTVNVKNSVIRGNIENITKYDQDTEDFNNVINLDNSYFEGAVVVTATHPGSTINMDNNTTWVAKGESHAENLNITDSTVDIQDAIVGADNWYSGNTNVLINSESQLNIGTGSGDMNVIIKSDGREVDTAGREIIHIQNGDIDIKADDVDLGAYKYQLVNKDGKWVLIRVSNDDTAVVLSGSANAVLSGLAAPLASWNSQTNTVYERLNSRLTENEGSVWGTYYGSEWAGEAGLSSAFNQKINGMAIGADKTLSLDNGRVTFGAAVMHDYSHLSGFDIRGSGGSMNSTAVQVYGRLAMDNGLFFKGTVSAGRADSKLHANASDGAVARADYKQNLFGLTGQAGYRYQVTPDVYVAPYAGMNGYTASGADFNLDNGMQVNSDRYWSARGELGMEAGVNTTVGGIAVTPHMTIAAGHEFVKNNNVHFNGAGRGFNNTVDGSGYKAGAGVDAQLTENLSGAVSVNYSHSKDTEQRFGVTAGVRYSF
ncbi:autotransporter outer membrane beta-barrel domain-containing protein [Morganella morganii]|nr:autotransporter outer membrane beta-barrel domain-containing protein [Morganella morganii]